MRLIPWTATLLLLACGKPTPTTSSDSSSVRKSAEALRLQRQLDAEDVERCRTLVEGCEEENDDADLGRSCARLSAHCAELDEQLADDRAELTRCLEAAAEQVPRTVQTNRPLVNPPIGIFSGAAAGPSSVRIARRSASAAVQTRAQRASTATKTSLIAVGASEAVQTDAETRAPMQQIAVRALG